MYSFPFHSFLIGSHNIMGVHMLSKSHVINIVEKWGSDNFESIALCNNVLAQFYYN